MRRFPRVETGTSTWLGGQAFEDCTELSRDRSAAAMLKDGASQAISQLVGSGPGVRAGAGTSANSRTIQYPRHL